MWTSDEHQKLNQAVTEFNRGEFFACHETLEYLWNHQTDEMKRRWLQGILQIAVGLHHVQQENIDGALNVLEKGLRNLIIPFYHEDFRVLNVDIDRLTDETQAYYDDLKNHRQSDKELPMIHVKTEATP